jgi:hypothetical protein
MRGGNIFSTRKKFYIFSQRSLGSIPLESIPGNNNEQLLSATKVRIEKESLTASVLGERGNIFTSNSKT